MGACRTAAGEKQPVDGAFHQRRPGLAPALHQLDHPIGQARRAPAIDHRRADSRAQFRRLENHGIACQQRGNDMAIGQVAGEVVGAQHHHHPMRAMAQYRLAKRHRAAALAGAFGLRGN